MTTKKVSWTLCKEDEGSDDVRAVHVVVLSRKNNKTIRQSPRPHGKGVTKYGPVLKMEPVDKSQLSSDEDLEIPIAVRMLLSYRVVFFLITLYH